MRRLRRKRDLKMALMVYQKAADKGNAEAMWRLASILVRCARRRATVAVRRRERRRTQQDEEQQQQDNEEQRLGDVESECENDDSENNIDINSRVLKNEK